MFFKKIKSAYNYLKGKIIKGSKKIILPGFGGLPLHDVVDFFFKGIQKSSLIARANALSFSFLLAIFPGILFFFTLIPYIPIENVDNIIMDTIRNALPEHAYNTVDQTIRGIVMQHNEGLLSLGFFVSIYFASNGMMGMMKAFNRTSHTIETRSNLKLRLISVLLVLFISILLIIGAAMLISTGILLKYMQNNDLITSDFTKLLINGGKWLTTLLMTFFAVSIIYYIAPASRKHSMFFSPGSILATILSFIFILGFNFYIDNFAQYNKLYGSIGTVIILMLWVNLNAITLLIGFELNATIMDARRRRERSLEGV